MLSIMHICIECISCVFRCSLFVALVLVCRCSCRSLVVISDLLVKDASSQESTEFQDVVYAVFDILIFVTSVLRSRYAFRLGHIIAEVDPYCPLCIAQSLLATEYFSACQYQANVGRGNSPSS
jgi:hypothetical protein